MKLKYKEKLLQLVPEKLQQKTTIIIDGLNTLHSKYSKNSMIPKININLIRNKFETIVSLVTSDLDIEILFKKLKF